MEIEFNTKNMKLWECLSSPSRIRMIEMISEKPMNLSDIADKLGISKAIVSRHVQQLESAGLIVSSSAPGERGRQKICRLLHDSMTIVFRQSPDVSADVDLIDIGNGYQVSIPIGHYSDFQVKPTCGLASSHKLIGMVDDPRYFADPEHTEAQHLWFACGFVEYRIPNYLVSKTKLTFLRISLEIGSEAPGFQEDWPSDIEFMVNDTPLGKWTSPGDSGSVKGLLNPTWWIKGDSQNGYQKTLMVTEEGSFIDGVKISNVCVSDLDIHTGDEISFRISSSESATYPGGVSLYGRQFGNYPQDIEVSIRYENIKQKSTA